MKKNYTRYKPLYKKFIRLRKNVQYRKKLIRYSLKSKKWSKLTSYLKRLRLRREKNFIIYDLTRHHLRRYGNYFNKKFLLNLLNKQRLSLFYGFLADYYVKGLVRNSIKYCASLKTLPATIFINRLEKRLDTLLYRAHFTISLRQSRSAIKHGHVYVNNFVIKNNKHCLKKGDVIKISPKYLTSAKRNVLSSHLWPIPPEYLTINYRSFHIVYTETFEIKSLFILLDFMKELIEFLL
jgi:ribosomal protein S4